MAKSRIGGSETRLLSAAGIAAVCLLVAFLFLGVLPKEDPRVSTVRQIFFDISSPLIEIAGTPGRALTNTRHYFQELETAHNRNRVLEAQNIELRQRISELTRAEVLMQQYRKLLYLPNEPGLELINAAVIADVNSPFVHTIVTKGGRRQGIKPGQAVMGPNGLIGRVISSGASSARVLLLTDFNSHIPVVALSSDVQAILSGTNRPQPELQFLPRQADLKNGDLLVTSGRGGQIPMGLPVALVTRNEDDGNSDSGGDGGGDGGGAIAIQLLDDLARLNFVRIVKSQEVEAPPAEIQLSPTQRAQR